MTANRDTYDRDCLRIITERGWMIQGVFPTENDPGVDFAYTVGLTAAGLPELVISGLPHETAATLLNDAARHSLTAEVKPGDVLNDIASVPFKVAPAPRAEVNMARHLYGPDTVLALQLVWPDNEGFYPGDAGWSLGDMQEIFA
jgi:hypothetical protein